MSPTQNCIHLVQRSTNENDLWMVLNKFLSNYFHSWLPCCLHIIHTVQRMHNNSQSLFRKREIMRTQEIISNCCFANRRMHWCWVVRWNQHWWCKAAPPAPPLHMLDQFQHGGWSYYFFLLPSFQGSNMFSFKVQLRFLCIFRIPFSTTTSCDVS